MFIINSIRLNPILCISDQLKDLKDYHCQTALHSWQSCSEIQRARQVSFIKVILIDGDNQQLYLDNQLIMKFKGSVFLQVAAKPPFCRISKISIVPTM